MDSKKEFNTQIYCSTKPQKNLRKAKREVKKARKLFNKKGWIEKETWLEQTHEGQWIAVSILTKAR